jgi:hypothetical protein
LWRGDRAAVRSDQFDAQAHRTGQLASSIDRERELGATLHAYAAVAFVGQRQALAGLFEVGAQDWSVSLQYLTQNGLVEFRLRQ